MDIKDFVKNTIQQVTEGVREARAYEMDQREKHYKENMCDWAEIGTMQVADRSPLKFDIAVTVQEETEAGANAGIKVCGVQFGGKAGVTASSETVSRIQFEIPIGFPST